MKVNRITLEIDREIEETTLKEFIDNLYSISIVKGLSITMEVEKAGSYDLNLPVPTLVSASIGNHTCLMPDEQSHNKGTVNQGEAKVVPLVGKERAGRPPITQEWLMDKARNKHSAEAIMKFFIQYKKFAERNQMAQWFRQLCDERMVEIRKASYPQQEAEEPQILTEVLNEKDAEQVRTDVIDQILAIKGKDYSILDLFIDPHTGRIPYTDEARIPLEELVEALEAIQGEEPALNATEDEE